VKGHVGQCVVKAEVKVGRKEHGNGHPVDIPAAKGVRGPQHVVKVVRIPVVADNAEDRNPHVGLEAVPLEQWLALIQSNRRRENGLQEQRQHQAPAHDKEGDLGELEVHLARYDASEAQDPEEAVPQEPNLGRPLGRAGLGIRQPPREGWVPLAGEEGREGGKRHQHAPDHSEDVVECLVRHHKVL